MRIARDGAAELLNILVVQDFFFINFCLVTLLLLFGQ